MGNRFSSYLSACTQTLSDDPALRLEIEQELKSHLEETREEEEENGVSPEEAEIRAQQRFGNPEEVANALFLSNRKRLSTRAKIRFWLKLAALPLLLAGLFLCIDFRTIAGMLYLGTLMSSDPEESDAMIPARILNSRTLSRLPEQERVLFSDALECRGPGSSGEIAHFRRLHALFPENRLITALFAQLLAEKSSSGGEVGKPFLRTAGQKQLLRELQTVLREGRKQDPRNALYDYLEAFVLASPAVFPERTESDGKDGKDGKNAPVYHLRVHDRRLLERAMEHYRNGLQKPFLKTGSLEFLRSQIRRLHPENDFFGQIQKFSLSASAALPHLNIHRQLARQVILYGETLLDEQDHAHAEPILRSWRIFLHQLLADNSDSLVEVLVCHAIGKIFLYSAQRRNDTEEIRKLTALGRSIDNWKERKNPDQTLLRTRGGWMQKMLLPGLKENISPDQLAPGRALTYALCDLLALALMSLFLVLLIAAHAIGLGVAQLRGHRALFLFPSWRSCLKAAGFGILLPLACYILFTRIDVLGGRGWAPEENWLRLLGGNLFLVFGIPLIYSWIVKRELRGSAGVLGFPKGRLPPATLSLNLLYFYVALLCLAGGVLRPELTRECRIQMERDPFFFSKEWDVLKAEHRLASKLSGSMIRALQDLRDKPDQNGRAWE